MILLDLVMPRALAIVCVFGAMVIAGCGESNSGSSTAARPSPNPPTVQGLAGAPVNLIAHGLRRNEVGTSYISRSRMSTALVSRVGRTEQAIDWALAVVNTSERHIESVMLNITYRGRRTVVNAVPFGKTIPPGVSIDVIISLPAPIGPEQDFEVEGTVTAVRFSDGQTMGDVNVLPHHEPTQPPKEPPFEGARLTPMSWPLQREEISLVRAEFSWGDGPSEDVTEAVEQWMVDPAWPTPLTVYPQALGLETKAQPHEKDRLTIFLIVGPSSKRIDVPVGQTLHVGGPTTLGSEPLVAREPVVVDGFRLVSAYFGGDDEWRDAMPGLAEIAARDGRIDTSVGEHLIGGEALRWPYPLLRLYFEYDGARWEARINEGESLQIPPSE